MQIVTLFLALIGSLLILIFGPLNGLIIYFIGLCWYPQPLVVSIGTVDFSLSRILIFALFASIFFRSKLLSKFKWNLMDTLVFAYFLGKVIAISQNEPIMTFIEREGGGFFDMIPPYFAARIIITTKEKLLVFIKSLVIIGIPLAIFGIYQSITGHNPFDFFTQYYGWGLAGRAGSHSQMRYGLYRANVLFTVHITFGLFLAGVTTLCLGLWYQQVWSWKRIIICFIILLLGVFSSMSSAPIFAIFIAMAILATFPLKVYRKLIVIILIASIIFLEYYSNRHWYEVFTRFAYSSNTASYRIGLINEAFGGGMTGHWITGYGYVGVSSPDTEFNWVHKDIVNIYLAILVRYGLLGLFPYLLINFLYYKRLYVTGSCVRTNADLWLIWCIMSILVGWNVAMMTVSAMGQVNTLLFMLIGICVNLPGFMLSYQDD